MASHKSVHSFFNIRWIPVIVVISTYLISLLITAIGDIWGYDSSLYDYVRTICIILFWVDIVVVYTWRVMFRGRLNCKVVMENNYNLPQRLDNITISLTTDYFSKRIKPKFTSGKGEYIFARKVPVGFNITINVKDGKKLVFAGNVGEIEEVKWLFGNPYFRLPISSGIPKYVNLVISNSPQPIISVQEQINTTLIS